MQRSPSDACVDATAAAEPVQIAVTKGTGCECCEGWRSISERTATRYR